MALLSVSDVVVVTGLSRATIYRLIQSKRLPSVKIGKRRGVRPESLVNFLLSQEDEI